MLIHRHKGRFLFFGWAGSEPMKGVVCVIHTNTHTHIYIYIKHNPWGLNKIDYVLQTTFQIHFWINEKSIVLNRIKPILGQSMALTEPRLIDIFFFSLGHNELITLCWRPVFRHIWRHTNISIKIARSLVVTIFIVHNARYMKCVWFK